MVTLYMHRCTRCKYTLCICICTFLCVCITTFLIYIYLVLICVSNRQLSLFTQYYRPYAKFNMAAAKLNFINQRNEPHHEKEHVKISTTATFQSCRPNTREMVDIYIHLPRIFGVFKCLPFCVSSANSSETWLYH